MAVRICILDSTCVSSEKGAVAAFGEAETLRLQNINNPIRRRESEAGLVALSRALDGREICDVVRDADGRPHFEKDIGLDFNISHSGALCVAAVCDGQTKRVGVDIERVREERHDKLVRIAERYFDEKEKELLGDGASPIEFYKVWVRKEASAKLLGAGLSKILSGKSSIKENVESLHFLIEYLGERYLLCLCFYGQSEINFICDKNIAVVPL